MSEFQPKNILVTGGAGFIGSNFVVHMLQKYESYKVVVLDKLSYCSNVKNLDPVIEKNCTFVKGDIQDADHVMDLLKTHEIDSIVHFAAETHVDNSFGNSVAFTNSNVLGTHVLLECIRSMRGQVRRFIHVSTDEVYGSCEDGVPKIEQVALDPTNPYAATKAAAEHLVMSYLHSFQLPIIITRGNNVYGPRQYPEKLIPKFINRLHRNMKLPLHGDGQNRRSFVYVMDVAKAFDLILHMGICGETYNIGTDNELRNIDVAEELIKAFGKEDQKNDIITFVPDRAFNDVRYFIDSSKLHELGWATQTSFAEGLKETINWYMNHSDHWGKESMERALRAHPIFTNPLTGKKQCQGKILDSPVKQVVPAACSDHIPESATYAISVLVLGHRGWIGGMICTILEQKGIQYYQSEVRMEMRESLSEELDRLCPTHVFNCAGVTGRPNVDWCEDNKEKTIKANVIGCLTMVDCCYERNIHVTNLATGCIFHYDHDRPMHTWDPDAKRWVNGGQFTEDCSPNFNGSWYSKTKGYVDQILKDSYPNVLNLRLRMPISDDLSPRNFITKISKYARVVNIPNSMSVLYDLLPLMVEMARARKSGIYNFTNPGVISHNQVLDLYTKYIDPKFTYKNFTLEEQDKILKAARSNNELSTAKLEKVAEELNIHLPHILDSMTQVFKRMAVNLGVPGAKRVDSEHRFHIFGAGGWLGGKVRDLLRKDGQMVTCSKVRMQNRIDVCAELDRIRPTHVLNCAGVTGRPNVDWCEDNRETTVRCNVIGTLNLADCCFQRNIHCAVLATGCIFHYDDETPMHKWDPKKLEWVAGGKFTEESSPNFTGSWYSKTKGYVDQILTSSFPNVLTLRLRMPISDDLSPRSFITKISKYAKVVNIPNSMSVIHDLLPLYIEMAKVNKTGVYNFTNPGVISHNQVLDLYKKYIDPTFEYQNFSLEEQDKILKAARSNNELDTTKLEECAKELGVPLPHILESIHGVYQRMAKNKGITTKLLN